MTLDLDPSDFTPNTGDDLQREPFTDRVVLTDGGVYDNLGLETAWKRYKTILVSDGGGQMKPEGDPKTDWVRHAYRINEIIDNQVRDLRKRQVIGSFVRGERSGAYWGIRTDAANYGVTPCLDCPHDKTITIANTKTRLEKMSEKTQNLLINWGYAVTDAAMRAHVDGKLAAATAFPCPGGVG
jgi:NTE family protein